MPVEFEERCEQDGCGAARLEHRHCLQHLTAEEFATAVQRLRAGDPLDARQTTITGEILLALLEALRSEDGQAVFPATDFGGAKFSDDADFDKARFSDDADFGEASFNGDACFRGVFERDAGFDDARFGGDANFRATFNGPARFRGAVFSGEANFFAVTFNDASRFDRAVFDRAASFRSTTFKRDAVFAQVTFGGDADFHDAFFEDGARFRARFSGNADFDHTFFYRTATFRGTSFERARQLGPLVAGDDFVLDDAEFAERVIIEVDARQLSARGARFAGGAQLRLRPADVELDAANFAQASSVSCAALLTDAGADNFRARTGRTRDSQLSQPRLISLRGAHVTDLSLSRVDLQACRFFGAHGLASLSIDASCDWPHTPAIFRFIDRETIAEEHDWRGSRWDDSTRTPVWLDSSEQLEPLQIAALYRALRKAREDDKDQAGTGDLYYGEMEMRRKTPPPERGQRGRIRARADHFILTMYWLLSGYGLKAYRAFIALGIAIVLAALGLQAWGFTPDPSRTRALLFSIESTCSLFRVPAAPGLDITYVGERIQIALRILGPTLIALAVLALRARVKR